MAYSIKLQIFEGPLDLLLHLIEKEKVDIRDIPIISVTTQYMQYLALMEQLDLDVASEFLVMAATLMDIKSRTLLPKPEPVREDEIDPREELVSRLLEYKAFKEIAAGLRSLESQQARHHTRPYPGYGRGLPDLDFMNGLGVTDLLKALGKILADVGEEWTEIPPEEISYRRRMRDVLLHFRGRPGQRVSFRDLLRQGAGRAEIIVTFLVILELIRVRKVMVSQVHPFEDIELLYTPRQAVKSSGQGPRGS